MENINVHQVEEILPYEYKPEPGVETSSFIDKSYPEQYSVYTSCEEEVDTEFERTNSWFVHVGPDHRTSAPYHTEHCSVKVKS